MHNTAWPGYFWQLRASFFREPGSLACTVSWEHANIAAAGVAHP